MCQPVTLGIAGPWCHGAMVRCHDTEILTPSFSRSALDEEVGLSERLEGRFRRFPGELTKGSTLDG